MVDIALDRLTDDLRLRTGEGGRVDIVLLDGPEDVRQRVMIHLRTWIGEWFLDTTHGVPYLQRILGHNRSRAVIESVLRAQILSVAGVTGIPAFSLSLDRAQRTVRADFTITTPRGPATAGVTLA